MKKEGKEGNEEEGLYLYNRDEQGSTSSIIDSEGKAAAVYDYDEYGNTEVLSGDSFGNELCYTGQVRDKSTGLYYYNARFYDSSVGSFTSQDSYRGEYNNPLTQNLYTYCAGDPVNRVDPTGHSWLGKKWKKLTKAVKKNKYVKKAVKATNAVKKKASAAIAKGKSFVRKTKEKCNSLKKSAKAKVGKAREYIKDKAGKARTAIKNTANQVKCSKFLNSAKAASRIGKGSTVVSATIGVAKIGVDAYHNKQNGMSALDVGNHIFVDTMILSGEIALGVATTALVAAGLAMLFPAAPIVLVAAAGVVGSIIASKIYNGVINKKINGKSIRDRAYVTNPPPKDIKSPSYDNRMRFNLRCN